MIATTKEDNFAIAGQPCASTVDLTARVPELKAAWPDGMPTEELAIWTGMSARDRGRALDRLRAVLAYHVAGRRDPAGHASSIPVSVPKFYVMLRAWDTRRSLLSLLPQARGRTPRQIVVPPVVLHAADELVRAAHALPHGKGGSINAIRPRSQESIAKELRERFGDRSLSWMRRLVAARRDVFERELAGGGDGFGRQIVIDSAALPLPLLPEGWNAGDEDGDVEPEIEWAVAAMVWDEGTRRICGHAVAHAPSTMRLHAEAATIAAERLGGMAMDGPMERRPVVVTTMPTEGTDAMEQLRIAKALRDAGIDADASFGPAGSELMRLTGGRIGLLELKPRFALLPYEGRLSRRDALDRFGRLPMTIGDARLVVEREVRLWNEKLAVPSSAAVSTSVVAERLLSVSRAMAGG